MRIYESEQSVHQFSHADFQYIPVLFNDVLRQGGTLADWALPPSPYFFPDFLLYALVQLPSSQADWIRLAICTSQLTCFAVLIWKLSSLAGGASGAVGTLCVFCSLLLGFDAGGLEFPTALYYLSDHGGQALVGLLSGFLLIRQGVRRDRFGVWLVTLLALLTTVSDPLFVISHLVALVFVLARTQTGTRKLWTSIALILACAIGVWLRTKLPLPPVQPLVVWGRSLDALHLFESHMKEPVAWVAYTGFLLGAVSIPLSSAGPSRTLVIWSWITIASTLIGLFIIGAEVLTWKSRYFVSLWIALVLLCGSALRPLLRHWLARVIALGCVSAVALSVAVPRLPNVAKIGKLKPKHVTCYDQAAKSHDINRCVATYWNAKTTLALADKPPLLSQVRADGVPDWWIMTRRMDWSTEPVDCAILSASESGVFISRFGQPSNTVECGDSQILLYGGPAREELNRRILPLLHAQVPRRR
jgi:hypothetical protein